MEYYAGYYDDYYAMVQQFQNLPRRVADLEQTVRRQNRRITDLERRVAALERRVFRTREAEEEVD